MKYYLAIDIGASSGRHIVGWREGGELKTEEVYRFPNGMKQQDGHLIWDIDALEREVRAGIAAARARFVSIESLSIDTWGVDYVLLDADGKAILPCYAYRDSRTIDSAAAVHRVISFDRLYERTGIQYQPFNTIYQLYDDLQTGRLEKAEEFLLMPEYLMFRLTGVKMHEYTNATTGGMINAQTCDYDREIVEALGLPARLFKVLSHPGQYVGDYEGIKVRLCATHDTGSAVEGIPMDAGSLYLSSGTWSLLGVRIPKAITTPASCRANLTNEGGNGYIRYLKNIMGLWIIQNIQKQLHISFADMVSLARSSHYSGVFDANDQRFSAPADMKAEIISALSEQDPEACSISDGDLILSVYRSLALCYKKAVEEIEKLTGRTYEALYIVGGGAKNALLNELTEEYTGKKVIALPMEATAIGNLKVQMEADR